MSEQHEERLAAIRARLAAVTPGPWELFPDGEMVSTSVRDYVNEPTHDYEPRVISWSPAESPPDAAFIAATPEDIAWLIGEVERLRADYTHKCEMHRRANDLAEKLLDNRKFSDATERGSRLMVNRPLHPSTFGYLQPTAEQIAKMRILREAALAYADAISEHVPDGPDKTFILRQHRQNAMWVNVAITRDADGTPRDGEVQP